MTAPTYVKEVLKKIASASFTYTIKISILNCRFLPVAKSGMGNKITDCPDSWR